MAQIVNGVTEINLEVAGVQPQLDDTDKIATSLYGKGTAAGDVAVDVDADGHIQMDELTHSALTSTDVVTVTGSAGQTADVKVTLDGEAVAAPTVAASIKISPIGGSKTVAATGTGEALVASATSAKMLYVRAKSANTGNVYFGDSAVDKTTSKQIILAPSEAVTVDAGTGYRLDVNEFYIDVDVNAEGVDFLYVA